MTYFVGLHNIKYHILTFHVYAIFLYDSNFKKIYHSLIINEISRLKHNIYYTKIYTFFC